MNSYEALYTNMKNSFTVENSGAKYTLGEYMLMKAGKKANSTLPASVPATASRGERAVASIVSFVNDKLTIKKPPVKDKTIRAFPFRSSMSAFLSAVAACSFLICFCVVGIRLISNTSPELDEAYITEYAPELEETVSVDYEA